MCHLTELVNTMYATCMFLHLRSCEFSRLFSFLHRILLLLDRTRFTLIDLLIVREVMEMGQFLFLSFWIITSTSNKISMRPGSEVIKLFSCSTQLSMKI